MAIRISKINFEKDSPHSPPQKNTYFTYLVLQFVHLLASICLNYIIVSGEKCLNMCILKITPVDSED